MLKFTVAHNCNGKAKNLTAKTKYLTAKPKISRQKQKPHGKTKNLTAKPNTSQQKPNTSRQKQIPTTKPKLFCVCREVFGFAVTVVGHRRGEYEQCKYILNSFVTIIS